MMSVDHGISMSPRAAPGQFRVCDRIDRPFRAIDDAPNVDIDDALEVGVTDPFPPGVALQRFATEFGGLRLYLSPR